MSDADYKICKLCSERKLRLTVGKYPSGNKKYQDDQGRLWNGRTCGECNNKRLSTTMKSTRKRLEMMREQLGN